MIAQSVVLTAAEVAVISTLCPPGKTPTASDWSAPVLKEIKTRIKKHYISEQGSRCCYCDQHNPSPNHRVWDLEHIVSRSLSPQFLLEVRNLAAACPDCNIAKGEKRVIKTNTRVRYPTRSEDFAIVHPHFDEYDEHIARSGYVYAAKSTKGRKTIYDCDLLRLAQRNIDWTNSATDKRFEAEVATIFSRSPGAAAAVMKAIAILQEAE